MNSLPVSRAKSSSTGIAVGNFYNLSWWYKVPTGRNQWWGDLGLVSQKHILPEGSVHKPTLCTMNTTQGVLILRRHLLFRLWKPPGLCGQQRGCLFLVCRNSTLIFTNSPNAVSHNGFSKTPRKQLQAEKLNHQCLLSMPLKLSHCVFNSKSPLKARQGIIVRNKREWHC